MKKAGWNLVTAATILWLSVGGVTAQKIDDQRMERDIEVAENVLSTLIKQKFDKRDFWHMSVEGKYMEGYGVTFRLPNDYNFGSFDFIGNNGVVVVNSAGGTPVKVYSDYSEDKERNGGKTPKPSATGVNTRIDRDSARQANQKAYYALIIEASKEFLADYGDFISQLKPEERIMITNRGEDYKYYNWGSNSKKRTLLTIEVSKGDLGQVRQGKLTREQLISKIKIVNTQSEEELSPDLELLSSILARLYRSDLSKTYFTTENIYYERLRDFGVIYYMGVSSSYPDDDKRHKMPTLNLEDVDQATRDKKVIEMFPVFEKDVKENLLEYGGTLKSLKDDELVTINIRMTKCEKCNIPSTLELSVKSNVLRDYAKGVLTKDAAIAKVNVKKGANQ